MNFPVLCATLFSVLAAVSLYGWIYKYRDANYDFLFAFSVLGLVACINAIINSDLVK